jgi:hypothetical protein
VQQIPCGSPKFIGCLIQAGSELWLSADALREPCNLFPNCFPDNRSGV